MVRPSSSTSDAAWLRAMLDVEAALARANAAAGVITAADADRVVAACAAEDWDAAALEAAGEAHATPVVPLVAQLRERAGDGAHAGATSQDIVDTAAMLVAARTRDAVLADAGRAAAACASLAEVHRGTPMVARTLLQAALPTSFGLKAAGWLHAMRTATGDLASVPLPVQMGGPVGHRDPRIAALVAADLGLAEPLVPWQADRGPVVALGAALGRLAGALAKPARDVVLLAQTEVGEAHDADAGRSSAMPHKRNPARAVGVLAAAHRAPGHVASLLAGMTGEHERAAGAWQAERASLTALLEIAVAVAAGAAALLEHLEIDTERMRRNLGDAAVDLGAADELITRVLKEQRP